MSELDSPRLAGLRRICQDRGITISRFGQAWLIGGAGVRLIVADLRYVTEADLLPTREHRTPRSRDA